MSYTPTEERAIRLFADTSNAVPRLSVRPMVRFKVRDTDEIVERHIIILVAAYWENHKANKRERARLAKRKANGR
jgi:hypothetical protein